MNEEQPNILKSVFKWSLFLLLVILVFLPLLFIIMEAFQVNHHWEVLAPFGMFMNSHTGVIILHSLELGAAVVVGATLLAAPIAFLMARTELGRHKWLDILLIVPFMTPPYIASLGWILFMQTNGYLDQLIPSLAFLHNSFFSLFGLVLVMSLHLFPFLYLILKNAFANISGLLDEAGRIHGGSMIYRLRKILLPLVFSSYSMGALLVFVKTISEFGTPITLGVRIKFFVLTSQIHRYTSTWPINFHNAAILSSFLLGMSLVAWFGQQLLSQKQYDVVSGRGYHLQRVTFGIRGAFLAWVYMVLILVLAIGVPFFSILATSLMKLLGFGLVLNNFTFAHYIAFFTPGSSGLHALLTSLGLSLISATLCMGIGTVSALLIMKRKNLLSKGIDILGLAPNMVPSIVMIVGLILFWNSPKLPFTVYDTWMMVALTYTILFLPYTIQYVKAIRGQISGTLLQAGHVHGGSSWYTFWHILFPLIRPGMIAGWMMSFTISIRELVGSLMVRPPDLDTTATYIFSQFNQGNLSIGMVMAVISVGMTTFFLVMIEIIQNRYR